MSYTSIAQSSIDESLVVRVRASTVQEAWNNPAVADTTFAHDVQLSWFVADRMVWPVCIASDVAAAYEFAVNAGNPDPGGDPSVITDGMILASVVDAWPADTP